jgi:hypothetical protein
MCGSLLSVALPDEKDTHLPACPPAAEFFANNIAEGAASQGPWLRAVTVPQVRAATCD